MSACFVWRGRAFEQVCIQHANLIAQLLGFSAVRYHYGPFFQNRAQDTPGSQVDLVFERADNVLTVCEMKYSLAPAGTSPIGEVEEKVAFVRSGFPRKTVQPALIGAGRSGRGATLPE